MATLNEISYNILNAMSGGGSTNDEPYSLRQIQFMVRYYRHLLIRRDGGYFKRMKDLEQDLGLISVSTVQQPIGRMAEMPTTVLRTNSEIPEPVRLRKRSPFTHIGAPDLGEHYDLMPEGQAKYQQFNKFTSSTPRAYHQGRYLYIESDAISTLVDDLRNGETSFSEVDSSDLEEGITTIRVKGIFARPEEAYHVAHGEPYDPDHEYPGMPDDMIQRITQSILSGEAQAMLNTPNDTEADHLPVNAEHKGNPSG